MGAPSRRDWRSPAGSGLLPSWTFGHLAVSVREWTAYCQDPVILFTVWTSLMRRVLCLTGLADGQAIVVTQLSASDLTKDYRSDASIDFVSYIQNPATSRDMVERLLYKRSGRFQLLLWGIFFIKRMLNMLWTQLDWQPVVPWKKVYFEFVLIFSGFMATVLPFLWCPLAMYQCPALLSLPIQTVWDLLPRATGQCCCTGIQVCVSENQIGLIEIVLALNWKYKNMMYQVTWLWEK